MREKRLLVPENEPEVRLDLFLTRELELSRSMVGKIFKDEEVWVNEKLAKPSQRPIPGSQVRVVFEEPSKPSAVPQAIPLTILYEDEDLVVLDKPRGMVVHPAAGNPDGTLVNALLNHCGSMSSVGGVMRPGIVHRIDKDTSGILVVAKNDKAHLGLSKQFHDHTIERVYIALVHGIFKQSSGTISGPIGRHPVQRKMMAIVANGRRAVTHYRVSEQLPKHAVIEARLETGRTHQIRVHLSHIGHPLVGDPVYGRKGEQYPIEGQALHAAVLGFTHPVTGESLRFESAIPEELKRTIEFCR